MKLDPSNPEHRALLERFLREHPEHADYIDPQRNVLMLVAPDEYVPLNEIIDQVQIVAMDWRAAQDDHADALQAHADAALSDQAMMWLDSDIAHLTRRSVDTSDRVPFSDEDAADLAKLRAIKTASAKAAPTPPEPQCSAEMVPYVHAAANASSTAELTAKLAKKHGVESCMHPDCDEPVMLTRQGTPRFGTRSWDSLTPWAGCGLCDADHADRFGDARRAAFNAFALWLPTAAVAMANEALAAQAVNVALVASVARLTDLFDDETAPTMEESATR